MEFRDALLLILRDLFDRSGNHHPKRQSYPRTCGPIVAALAPEVLCKA
jgi:hypothetical protein